MALRAPPPDPSTLLDVRNITKRFGTGEEAIVARKLREALTA